MGFLGLNPNDIEKKFLIKNRAEDETILKSLDEHAGLKKHLDFLKKGFSLHSDVLPLTPGLLKKYLKKMK